MTEFLKTSSIVTEPPMNSFLKRPFRISAYLGIQGSIFAIIGTFFPWFGSLATTLEWTSGIDTPIGLFTLICSLIALILFVFREQRMFMGGTIMGLLIMIPSGIITLWGALGNLIAVGVCLSFVGGMLMTAGGYIGSVRIPETQNIVDE